MLTFRVTGDFKNTYKFFDNAAVKLPKEIKAIYDKYGAKGVNVLSAATPVDTGKTASNWYYRISGYTIIWGNSNLTTTGVPIAILLQYGHGTRNGGYVQARDFINPAIKVIFEEIADAIWREVNNL